MRILLADDEWLIRESLKSILEELDCFPQDIEEAANGLEMVEKVKSFQPDLAFVDIQMPGLTGLEAIKCGQVLSPATQWIILTGYSEFSYAQEAIRLGASGYLLKPVSPEDLQASLEKTFKAQQEYRTKVNKEFEHDMSALFHGVKTVNELSRNLQHTELHHALVVIDSRLEEAKKAEALSSFCSHVQQITEESQSRSAFFPLSHNEFAYITVGDIYQDKIRDKSLPTSLAKIQKILQDFCKDDFSVTILIGTYSSLENSKNMISELRDIAPFRTIGGLKKIINAEQLNKLKKDPAYYRLVSALIKLSDSYQAKSSLTYMKTIDDVEKYILTIDSDSVQERVREFLNCVIPCSLRAKQLPTEWAAALMKCGDNLLKEHSTDEDRSQFLVDQVIKYVEENYMDNIGIGQIAQELHVTPNYLSTLFHKRIGITFIKYLTRIRILKAKELLADPNNKIQKVAETVGYYSTRHFTKLFTEIIGCYPSEFQRAIRK
ncbi:response regulator transcription factor [Peribacillus kribbensis]|uniref:response regulator transcription factor n=1 Tax=Peribacillus kribbensis TaxID=356658 RepID=UPI00040BC310|nr:response regulator [Peribacillus kribbensis]